MYSRARRSSCARLLTSCTRSFGCCCGCCLFGCLLFLGLFHGDIHSLCEIFHKGNLAHPVHKRVASENHTEELGRVFCRQVSELHVVMIKIIAYQSRCSVEPSLCQTCHIDFLVLCR